MTIDIKNILRLFQSNISMQQSTPRGLGTSWHQDPVTLEDALGFRIPIPLELVNSWDMLDIILVKRFEKRSGHQKVLKGEYVIEEGITGRDVSRENELIMCLRPGQKIDMSMIFSDLGGDSNRCPRCFTKLEASSESRTQCVNIYCQMWFQRLVGIDESELEPIPSPVEMVSEEPAANSRSSRTKRHVVTPADFQRVRLLSTLRKTAETYDDGAEVSIVRRPSIRNGSNQSGSEYQPLTIRFKGPAKLNIGGAMIICDDGAEINIVRRPSIRNGSSQSSSKYRPSIDGRRSRDSRASNYSRSTSQSIRRSTIDNWL